MLRITEGRLAVQQGTETLFSDFASDGPMWTGEGQRERRVAVRFATAFRAAPVVHVALAMLDLDGQRNHRTEILAEAIGPAGFEIVFRTWGDSRIARARASWLALGEVAADDLWEV